MVKISKSTRSAAGSFVLGRKDFGKISAVEGIHMSRGMKEAFGEFDSKKLSAKERRLALFGKFGAKR